jgi:hypothetical protein
VGNSFVLSPRGSDSATISASDNAAGTSATNLLLPRPSQLWQSQVDNPAVLVDLGSAKPVDTLLLGYLNGVSGDVFRLRGADTEANLTAAPTYDSDNDHPSGVTAWPAGSDLSAYELHHRHFELDATYTLRWWRVDFNFGGNPDGFVRAGRLILGERVEPVHPVIYPAALTAAEAVAETVDFGGEESPRPRGTKRAVGATFAWATKAEAIIFYRMMLWLGSHKDVVLCLDKTDDVAHMEVTYLGRVKEPQIINATSFNRWAVTSEVSELGPIPMAD